MVRRAPNRGGVRKLPSGRWQARYVGPDEKRYNAPMTFQTKGDAQAWLASITASISAGTWTSPDDAPEPAATSFGEFAERWLTTRRVKGRPLADRTRDAYRDLLDAYILPTFGALPLRGITRPAVDRWFDDLGSAKPAMRAHAYALLRSILATAVAEEYITLQPARIRGGGQADSRHRVQPASLAELGMLDHAMPERLRLMVLLAAWCALRYGELTELRRTDIDVRHGVINVSRAVVATKRGFVVKTPKSKAGDRDVYIPPHLMPAVRAHLLQHTASGPDGLLFPSVGDPALHMRQSTFCKSYYPARKAAGRPDLRFHDLRHTGAVLAAQTGATLAELMARLGHSTPAAAMRYQHAAQGRDRIIAAALSEMAEGGGAVVGQQ